MELNIKEHDDFIFAEKPYGVSTHRPSEDRIGFCEYLSNHLKCPLWVCHRLDKETSGAIVFSKSKESAAKLSSLFENHKVNKRYYFLTDRTFKDEDFTVSSKISRKGSLYISEEDGEPNATTTFKLKQRHDKLSLWSAIPHTGQTHQIRLHASSAGIPILGDVLYNGSKAERLFLHSTSISFSIDKIDYTFSSSIPFEASNLKNCWSLALSRRKAIYEIKEHSVLRIIHDEDPEVEINKLGETLWVSWYKKSLPSDSDEVNLKTIMNDSSSTSFIISHMENRGDSKAKGELINPFGIENWFAEENGVKMLLKADQGRSPGVFVDQRKNRVFIKENSHRKKVLNLFCYSGLFSVAAGLGGASQIVSVDTSKAALEWAKENFTLNDFNPDLFQFWHDDARDVIARLQRRKEMFDIVICDPPTFARSKGKIFSLEKELLNLVSDLVTLLTPHGFLLFSSNAEKLSGKTLLSKFKNALSSHDIELIQPEWDVGFPGENILLKTVIIRKDIRSLKGKIKTSINIEELRSDRKW